MEKTEKNRRDGEWDVERGRSFEGGGFAQKSWQSSLWPFLISEAYCVYLCKRSQIEAKFSEVDLLYQSRRSDVGSTPSFSCLLRFIKYLT